MICTYLNKNELRSFRDYTVVSTGNMYMWLHQILILTCLNATHFPRREFLSRIPVIDIYTTFVARYQMAHTVVSIGI